MSLRDEIKILTGNRRRYLLLRIVDMDKDSSLKLVGIKNGTYNTWLQNPGFVELHRRIAEFSGEYKQEAIQLLRRDNQLDAVLLEGKIVRKMKAEIEAGEYDLVRTNLAREVYSRLMGDLDHQPQTQVLTWEQRINQLNVRSIPEELTRGETINGESRLIETADVKEN